MGLPRDLPPTLLGKGLNSYTFRLPLYTRVPPQQNVQRTLRKARRLTLTFMCFLSSTALRVGRERQSASDSNKSQLSGSEGGAISLPLEFLWLPKKKFLVQMPLMLYEPNVHVRKTTPGRRGHNDFQCTNLSKVTRFVRRCIAQGSYSAVL